MKEEWYVVLACLRHVTGNIKLFSELKRKDYRNVRFVDNIKGRIIEKRTFRINLIEDVSLVDGLKLNLISAIQLSDKGIKVTFGKTHYYAVKLTDNNSVFKAKRKENTYVVNLEKVLTDMHICLASIVQKSILWHKRLGHASMSHIPKP